MEQSNRGKLDERIRSFFLEELRKEFSESDIKLVANKLDGIINDNTIKDARYLVRQELNKLKDQRR